MPFLRNRTNNSNDSTESVRDLVGLQYQRLQLFSIAFFAGGNTAEANDSSESVEGGSANDSIMGVQGSENASADITPEDPELVGSSYILLHSTRQSWGRAFLPTFKNLSFFQK